MQKLRTGELLQKFRREKGISARRICKGICTVSAIANYESGERIMDTVMFEHFLERMGIAPNNFALMLDNEEYAYYMWKEKCYQAVEESAWEELEQLLNSEVATKLVGNYKIQEQFYDYMRAILYGEKYKQYEKASILLLGAAQKTIPNIYEISQNKMLLGAKEVHIILMYLYYGLRGDLVEDEIAKRLFQELENYCESDCLEKGEKAKLFSKLVCIWVNCDNSDMTIERKVQLCQNAIELSRSHNMFYDITELLKLYIPLLEKFQSPEVAFYRKQYEAFQEILLYAGMEVKFRPEIIGLRSPKIYLINEYLKYKRKGRKLTQESTSEGICEPETYSRIERGTRAPSPKNMLALAERLDIGWHYYRGEFDADNRKVYLLRKKQRTAAIKENWQESLDILKEMEKLLDMNLIPNIQYIRSKENIAKQRMKLVGLEEAYEKDMELLELTTTLNSGGRQLAYYSQTELEIIGHMGQLLKMQGNNLEGIELLENVLHRMSQSEVELVFQWFGVSFVLRVLSDLYFEQGEYQKAYDIMYRVYKENVRYQNGGNLPEILDSMSDSLEHLGTQHSDEYKKLCRLAFYMADFYDIQYAKRILQRYYEEMWEARYEWYPV